MVVVVVVVVIEPWAGSMLCMLHVERICRSLITSKDSLRLKCEVY